MPFLSLLHLNIVYSYLLLLNNQQIKVTEKGVIINKQINIILFDLLQIFIITVVFIKNLRQQTITLRNVINNNK